jgi:hypothetical protein
MATPTEGPLTSETGIEVRWAALTTPTETGGATIRSYNLQWHAGGADPDAVWTDLAGYIADYPGTSYVVTGGIVGGATYSFRVRARNIWGWGATSPEVALVASAVPGQVPVPTTSIDEATGGLAVSWGAPDPHGSAVTQYKVEVRDKVGAQWATTSSCDGATASVVATRSCLIPMPILTAGPYSYTLGDLVAVRVRAYNLKGEGQVSEENTSGATAKTVPTAPAAVTRGSSTSPSQVEAVWVALATTAETGGLPIRSYELEYDQGASAEPVGGSSWTTLVGNPSDSLLTSYTASGSSIVGGTTYRFRLRARNAVGWGAWSPVASIAASAVPAQMAAVTTQIDPGLDPLSVKISWVAPDANSDAIQGYHVTIRARSGEYLEDLTNCNAGLAAIATARQCLVPLTTLRTTFSLAYNDLVVARARAYNSLGNGQYSQPNAAGATIQTEPSIMATPTRGATTLTSIQVNWVALAAAATGGAAVDSYELEYKEDPGGSSWTKLQGQDGSYSTALTGTLASATAGTWYLFRVRAHNVHGWGQESPEVRIQAADVPG